MTDSDAPAVIQITEMPAPYEDTSPSAVRVDEPTADEAPSATPRRVYLLPVDVAALQHQLHAISESTSLVAEESIVSSERAETYRLRSYVASLHHEGRRCVGCAERVAPDTSEAALVQQYDRHGDTPTMMSVAFHTGCAASFNDRLSEVWSSADVFLGDVL